MTETLIDWLGPIQNLPKVPTFFVCATVHCLNGTIAAAIAAKRGHSFRRWIGWSLVAGSVAIPAAFWVRPAAIDS